MAEDRIQRPGLIQIEIGIHLHFEIRKNGERDSELVKIVDWEKKECETKE
jgi:murein DD-endopeptidase MepM/ murein hydrolase activator NlpD